LNVQARATHDNPSPEELRAFTEAMPQSRVTEYGNVNVQTVVTSRSAGSTHVVAERSSGKTMTRESSTGSPPCRTPTCASRRSW
jgi:hypothetical protein